MTNNSIKYLLSFVLLSMLIVSCQLNQDKPELNRLTASDKKDSTSNQQHLEIVKFVEKLLNAAGNKNVEAMKEMIFDQALVGNTYSKDSLWMSKQWTIDEFYKIYQNDQSKPYLEIVDDYDIILSERMALVKADATLNQFGVPGKREINHITLIKSDDQWKLFSIAWSVHEQPKEKLIFDINIFARGYAQVWGSQRPEFVAMFFEDDGALHVNDGEPAIGRNEISNVAQSFMTKFPDLNVRFDSLAHKPNGLEFHWTLTGTDADPNGKGHKVKVSGFELWTMSENNLIKVSKGTFPSEEYNHQLEFGINN